ncbi:MAG: fibronectin type III domain-containing protein [Bacteroidota bacterium]|nr:MAG: fibronectin type III domain-containing protein [Bacteroidota bacterium]
MSVGCNWIMPAMPTLACYETASFNNNTCQWDVTGSMPAMPSLACYQTASFNTTTCQWDVTGSPNAPIITTDSGCDSYTWSVNNQSYTSSGTYTVNIGCQDYILYLTLGQSTSSTITITQPVSYTWGCNNTTYTTSGTYTCTGTNSTGCPDVQTLILTIGGCNLTVTAANVSGCPNSPIALSGTPAGGTFSVANPYTGPSTTYTYTYTDPNTGCTGTATGTITVANLAAVTITSVVVTGPTTATVNWNPVAGLGWYEVRYRPVGAGSWTGGGTQAAPTSYKNLAGLTAGTTYEVEVRGFCSIGNPGPWGSIPCSQPRLLAEHLQVCLLLL